MTERLGPDIYACAEKVRVGTRLTGDAVSTACTPKGRRVPEQASVKAPAELRKGRIGIIRRRHAGRPQSLEQSAGRPHRGNRSPFSACAGDDRTGLSDRRRRPPLVHRAAGPRENRRLSPPAPGSVLVRKEWAASRHRLDGGSAPTARAGPFADGDAMERALKACPRSLFRVMSERRAGPRVAARAR